MLGIRSVGHDNSPTKLQELLYWGSYWGQNWQVGHDQAPFSQTALDYAPLFHQLRGKLWAGDAHAVSVVGGTDTGTGSHSAAVNLFEIEAPKATSSSSSSSGNTSRSAGAAQEAAAARVRVLVVVFGAANGSVTVAVRSAGVGAVAEYTSATLFHPGSPAVTLVAPKVVDGVAHVDVPLSHGDPHGCAVVRLVPAS